MSFCLKLLKSVDQNWLDVDVLKRYLFWPDNINVLNRKDANIMYVNYLYVDFYVCIYMANCSFLESFILDLLGISCILFALEALTCTCGPLHVLTVWIFRCCSSFKGMVASKEMHTKLHYFWQSSILLYSFWDNSVLLCNTHLQFNFVIVVITIIICMLYCNIN